MSERQGLNLIKEREGFRSHAYQDTGGVWTNGYGETMGVKPGDVVTEHDALIRLINRYDGFEREILRLCRVSLTQNQLGALVCFVYNIGVNAFAKSTLLRKLNAGDYLGASNEFGRWIRDNGVVLNGLVKRREAERQLFLSP